MRTRNQESRQPTRAWPSREVQEKITPPSHCCHLPTAAVASRSESLKFFRNAHPKPGEQATYQGLAFTGSSGEDYATISLLPLANGRGSVPIGKPEVLPECAPETRRAGNLPGLGLHGKFRRRLRHHLTVATCQRPR